jgi:hypothetical protein
MQKKYGAFFPSEHAYRIATTLHACRENGESEILLPDLAKIAMVHYGVALYWINIFEACGFIHITRYENRKNAICFHNRHIIIHLTRKEKLANLYNYTWSQEWEKQFCDDIGATTKLRLMVA